MAADRAETKRAGTAMRRKALPKDDGGGHRGPCEGRAAGCCAMRLDRTPCPFGGSCREEDAERPAIRDGFSDRNMPRGTEAVEALPEALCRRTGMTAGNACVFEHDVLRRPGGEGAASFDPDKGRPVLPRSVAGRPRPSWKPARPRATRSPRSARTRHRHTMAMQCEHSPARRGIDTGYRRRRLPRTVETAP